MLFQIEIYILRLELGLNKSCDDNVFEGYAQND